ncbi:sensor histidine kinase [Chloroflexota bacterium]
MADYKTTLLKLNNNLQTLRERESKYAGNAPLDLLNQITDHKQAILNLIDNAIKYNRPNGTVDVTLTCNESTAELSVRDTGSDIPSDELESIFDRFYRIRGSEHDEGGIGLGLTIVRQIIEAHDGAIGVESELGVGSTFSFSLPLQRAIK